MVKCVNFCDEILQNFWENCKQTIWSTFLPLSVELYYLKLTPKFIVLISVAINIYLL